MMSQTIKSKQVFLMDFQVVHSLGELIRFCFPLDSAQAFCFFPSVDYQALSVPQGQGCLPSGDGGLCCIPQEEKDALQIQGLAGLGVK